MNRRVLQGLPMVAAPAALSHDEAVAAPPLPGRCMGCYGKGFRGGQQQLVGRCGRSDQKLCGKRCRVFPTRSSVAPAVRAAAAAVAERLGPQRSEVVSRSSNTNSNSSMSKQSSVVVFARSAAAAASTSPAEAPRPPQPQPLNPWVKERSLRPQASWYAAFVSSQCAL